MADELIYDYKEDINGEKWCKNNITSFSSEDQGIIANPILQQLAKAFNWKSATCIDTNPVFYLDQDGQNFYILMQKKSSKIRIILNNTNYNIIKFKGYDTGSGRLNLILLSKIEEIDGVKQNVFTLTSSNQGDVRYCLNEISYGISILIKDTYRWNDEKLLNNTFNFTLLKENQPEVPNSLISYKDETNIKYIYTPLYYINKKQMTAIQQQYTVILENPKDDGFIWNQNFIIKDTTFNKQFETNKVWNFNFAEKELWLWDNFEGDNDISVLIGYRKDEQTLRIKTGLSEQIQEIKDINMDDYQIYLLQRNFNFNLEKGIDSNHRESIASSKLTVSRLFNDDAQDEIMIRGDCVLNRFQLDLTETATYLFTGDSLTRHTSAGDQEIIPNWQETPNSFFNNLYHQDILEYSQRLTVKAQKYDNSNGYNYIIPPAAVMTGVNWTWYTDTNHERYQWNENINSTILLNFSVLINNFISHIPPTLSASSILQDNYCLSPENWETIVRLSNIQIFIATPISLQLPPYFSLLEDKDTFTNAREIRSQVASTKYTYAFEVLDKANKDHYLWNDYDTDYSSFSYRSCYSNITFAATRLKTKQELQNFARNWDTYNNKKTITYGLILKKIK